MSKFSVDFLRIFSILQPEKMRIVCLIENTSGNEKLKSEFGLSFYLETESHKVLFDMGAGSGFWENACSLGIDLSEVDTAILSHGHYDHGGGLRTFLERNGKAPVYVQEGAFRDFYSRTPQGYSFIGLDRELEGHPRLVKVTGNLVIDRELQLLSGTTGRREWVPASNSTLAVRNGKEYVQDDFPHEQNLMVSANGVHVLFSGCSHCGIVNILEQSEAQTGIIPGHVIGGFHLCNPRTGKCTEPSVLNRLSSFLSGRHTVYHTCHCTGQEAFEHLRSLMGDRVRYMRTGEALFL